MIIILLTLQWPIYASLGLNGLTHCPPQMHYSRADSRFAPSQWETALLCNDVSHWLGVKPRISPFTAKLICANTCSDNGSIQCLAMAQCFHPRVSTQNILKLFRYKSMLIYFYIRLTSQIPECINEIPHTARLCNRNGHIPVRQWCIVGCMTSVFGDLWDGCKTLTVVFKFGCVLRGHQRFCIKLMLVRTDTWPSLRTGGLYLLSCLTKVFQITTLKKHRSETLSMGNYWDPGLISMG